MADAERNFFSVFFFFKKKEKKDATRSVTFSTINNETHLDNTQRTKKKYL